jgi:hypothetical protein
MQLQVAASAQRVSIGPLRQMRCQSLFRSISRAQEHRPAGLFIDKLNHKGVKSWAELVRDCEARLAFVQEKLQIEVSGEEIQTRIAQLKASVLKSEALEPVDGEAVERPAATGHTAKTKPQENDRTTIL